MADIDNNCIIVCSGIDCTKTYWIYYHGHGNCDHEEFIWQMFWLSP